MPNNSLMNKEYFNKIIDKIPFPIIYEGSEEIINTYNLFRRTILNPDKKDIYESEEYIEFLIDKYGYIRSRWKRAEMSDNNKIFDYISKIKSLEKEGKILDFPDEHVH